MLLLVAKKMERFCDSSSAKASTFPLFKIPSALDGDRRGALKEADGEIKKKGREVLYIPLITGEVIIDACFHVLQRVQSGKHINELGQSQEVSLRDERLPLLWVS